MWLQEIYKDGRNNQGKPTETFS